MLDTILAWAVFPQNQTCRFSNPIPVRSSSPHPSSTSPFLFKNHGEQAMAITTLPRNLIGADATWAIRNDIGTSNGLPTGGFSQNAPGFPGLGVADASVGLQADAFDNGLLLFVNDQIFVAPNFVDLTGSTLTTGAVVMSGLNTSVQFYADQNQPVLRTMVTFTNPTNVPISVPVTWATNVGSDADTTIQASSNGDTNFTIADRWVITDDAPVGGDPANTFVLFGPGSPTVALSSVSQTVYDFSVKASTAGILANYSVTIPAQSTRSLLFFNGINPTSSEAQAFASTYDSISAIESTSLLTGLSDEQRAEVLNWRFIPRAFVGTSNNDTLKGTNQRDFLFGKEGDDVLNGRKGDDVLEGGPGGDILRGGPGADVFVYAGPTRGRALATSAIQKKRAVVGMDQITDFNVRKGDRLAISHIKPTGTVTQAPRQVYNVGPPVKGRTLVNVMEEVFDDKNVVRKGQQALKPNEAVIVKARTRAIPETRLYLAVNDRKPGFSLKRDLVIDITGAVLQPGDVNAFSLNPADYFVTQ
jgi:Ca2+-binding RTX toxin-like protein